MDSGYLSGGSNSSNHGGAAGVPKPDPWDEPAKPAAAQQIDFFADMGMNAKPSFSGGKPARTSRLSMSSPTRSGSGASDSADFGGSSSISALNGHTDNERSRSSSGRLSMDAGDTAAAAAAPAWDEDEDLDDL